MIILQDIANALRAGSEDELQMANDIEVYLKAKPIMPKWGVQVRLEDNNGLVFVHMMVDDVEHQSVLTLDRKVHLRCMTAELILRDA